ncbi:hypothetical protein ACFWOT_09090 [Streptomyces sp. NPDC058440]|uniref:hypothetical protein n=1 Tax=Streptomyces sp. NPDC058440 TaxID=3346501 RepID=UPI00366715DB
MRKFLPAIFRKKTTPAPVAVDLNTPNRYTVVLDWDGDLGCLDAPVVHVDAHNRMGAMYAAREAAWHSYAGCIDEIPEGAEYDEAEAEDLWYVVTILDGFAVEATA